MSWASESVQRTVKDRKCIYVVRLCRDWNRTGLGGLGLAVATLFVMGTVITVLPVIVFVAIFFVFATWVVSLR